jgi:hypothetical protein
MNTFDKLEDADFMRIARSWAAKGKSAEKILVNLSLPDVIIVDPVCLPRSYKFMEFEIGDDAVLVCIGND